MRFISQLDSFVPNVNLFLDAVFGVTNFRCFFTALLIIFGLNDLSFVPLLIVWPKHSNGVAFFHLDVFHLFEFDDLRFVGENFSGCVYAGCRVGQFLERAVRGRVVVVRSSAATTATAATTCYRYVSNDASHLLNNRRLFRGDEL